MLRSPFAENSSLSSLNQAVDALDKFPAPELKKGRIPVEGCAVRETSLTLSLPDLGQDLGKTSCTLFVVGLCSCQHLRTCKGYLARHYSGRLPIRQVCRPVITLIAVVSFACCRHLYLEKYANRRDPLRRRVCVAGVRQAGRGDEDDPVQAEGPLGEVRPPRSWYDSAFALFVFVALDFHRCKKAHGIRKMDESLVFLTKSVPCALASSPLLFLLAPPHSAY